MTEREKAIAELGYMKQYFYYADSRKAIDVAIEALSEEPRAKGHWIYEGHDDFNHYHRCSNCMKLSRDIMPRSYYYCPNCGADMRKED